MFGWHENASKATCKNHDPTTPTTSTTGGAGGAGETPAVDPSYVKPVPLIYDPVQTSPTRVLDSEHHIEQHEHMKPDQPTPDNGPRGDWRNGKWSMV